MEDHSKKEIWRSVFDPPVIGGASAIVGTVSSKALNNISALNSPADEDA